MISTVVVSVKKNDNACHDTPDRVPGMWGINPALNPIEDHLFALRLRIVL